MDKRGLLDKLQARVFTLKGEEDLLGGDAVSEEFQAANKVQSSCRAFPPSQWFVADRSCHVFRMHSPIRQTSRAMYNLCEPAGTFFPVSAKYSAVRSAKLYSLLPQLLLCIAHQWIHFNLTLSSKVSSVITCQIRSLCCYM